MHDRWLPVFTQTQLKVGIRAFYAMQKSETHAKTTKL